jgi:hypothetical protein
MKVKVTDVKNKADQKFIMEFFGSEFYQEGSVTRQNMFSVQSVEVSKGVGMLVDFIMRVQDIYNNDAACKAFHPKLTARNAISKFDRARYLVMKLDNAAYFALLD